MLRRMSDPLQDPLLFTLGALFVPAAVAGVVLFAARKLRASDALGWSGALAVGLAYPLGHRSSLEHWPAWNPASANEALLWTGVLAALGAAVAARLPRAASSALLGATAALSAWLVTRRVFERSPLGEQVLVLALSFAIGALVAPAFDRFAERARGASAPLLLWLATSAGAVAMALAGTLVFAQFAASLAAVLGAAVVVALLARDVGFAHGLTAACIVQLSTLCLAAVQLSRLGPTSALLVVLAPLAAFAVPRATQGRRALLLRALAVAAPLALAVALAFAGRPAASGY